MTSNKQLTPRDFEISFQLKVAMNALNVGDVDAAKENVRNALRILHE